MYKRFMIYLSLLLLATSTYAAENETGFKVPFQYGLGKNLFEASCSECHGKWGKGADKGPPLMHRFYIASHHGDAAFYQAALTGTRAHHWNFGDMPAVAGMTREKMGKIIPYVRWLQQKNGIH
jgi:mono/diheme cytochrome c family protein